MIEKESEYIDDPIHVFLYEEPNIGPVLLMTFYNGMEDTLDQVVRWLSGSVFSYLDSVTVTVVDTCDLGMRDQGNRGSLSGGPQTPYTGQTQGEGT